LVFLCWLNFILSSQKDLTYKKSIIFEFDDLFFFNFQYIPPLERELFLEKYTNSLIKYEDVEEGENLLNCLWSEKIDEPFWTENFEIPMKTFILSKIYTFLNERQIKYLLKLSRKSDNWEFEIFNKQKHNQEAFDEKDVLENYICQIFQIKMLPKKKSMKI